MPQCLLIDEDVAERRTLSALFDGLGFATRESDNAADALTACRNNLPDVVVMTDRIGGMASADFLKRIQRVGHGRPPIVLLCADSPDSEEIGRAILEGASECLVRPFDRELLEFKLKQVGLI